MFYVLWPMVYQRMLIFIVRKNIFIMKKKYFHREEKYFHREEKYFHHDEKTVYLEEVPLSNMLTMENNVKQIAPSPANTRAGMA